MTVPFHLLDRELSVTDQALYDRFDQGLNEARDILGNLLDEIVGRYPGGRDAIDEGLLARITNDVNVLSTDVQDDLEFAIMCLDSDGEADDDDGPPGSPAPPDTDPGGPATGKRRRNPVAARAVKKPEGRKLIKAPVKSKAKNADAVGAAGKKPGKGRKR